LACEKRKNKLNVFSQSEQIEKFTEYFKFYFDKKLVLLNILQRNLLQPKQNKSLVLLGYFNYFS